MIVRTLSAPAHRMRAAGCCLSLALALPGILGGCSGVPHRAAVDAAVPATGPVGYRVPVEYYRLRNGLRVVLSPERSVPTVTVATHYHIGWRLEPEGRTGFAHLFEHLMFQESTNLAKGEANQIIQGNGGVGNGQTHYDYTNYYEIVPSHALEPVLWVEAERLRGLAVGAESLKNQQEVVKNEVRVNVLNRPYGGFGWLDVPQYANANWHNAHNFYGDLADIDAATLDDVRAFYDTYYTPRNAVLVVAGDFDTAQAKAWIEQYFGPLADRPEPSRPDVSEPAQTEEKRATRTDPLAPRPALALAYHVPARNSRDWYAFSLLSAVLLDGEESRLWRRLVREKGYSDSVSGGINYGGSLFDYDGPTLWTVTLLHDASTADADIVREFDRVVADLAQQPVTADERQRASTRLRSSFYDLAGDSRRVGLVTLLASFALFDDDPGRVNRIETEFGRITAADLERVAREYLVPTNRTVLRLVPGAEGGR